MQTKVNSIKFKSLAPAQVRFNYEFYRGNGVSLYRLADGKIALDITHRRNKRNAKQARISKRSKRNSRK